MNNDLFEQFAQSQPPPPPQRLRQNVHDRLNGYLTVMHCVDLALRGLPWAFGCFLPAMFASLRFSLTGRHEPFARKPPKS